MAESDNHERASVQAPESDAVCAQIAALRESAGTPYGGLFEHMAAGCAYCRMIFEDGEPRDFVYLATNAAFERLTGLRDVAGKRVTEVIPGIREADPELFALYGRVATTGEPENVELFVQALQMWFCVSVYRPGEGCFVAIFDVITARKQAEEESRRRTSGLEAALDAQRDIVVECDTQMRVEWASPRFRTTFGFRPEGLLLAEVLPRVAARPLEGRPVPFDEHPTPRALRGARVIARPYIVSRADGTEAVIEVSASPMLADGKVVGAVAAWHDVTEHRRAEAEKGKLESQLQQAQKMEAVGRLAGGVAHDFNNMLATILGYTELVLRTVDSDAPIFADLMEIQRAAERSAALTHQLLAFARKQTITPRVLDLNEVVPGMLKMLQRLIGEDVRLTWLPGAALWPVRGDASQIDQMLANLCINARDAIDDVGQVTIETSNRSLDDEYCAAHPESVRGDYVRLVVSDSGCGMDKETQARAFEPFFTTKPTGKGTGLGLASVYGSVKQNGGFISVYSEPGRGTTIAIYLPRYRGGAERAPVGPRASLPARGNQTILLVEDEPALLTMTTRVLEAQGYTVLAADGPSAALRVASEYLGGIQLLITDVVMPEMNGRDLAKALQRERPGLACVFMSGYTAEVIGHQGMLDESVSFLEKPFSAKALAERIRETLAAAEGPAGPHA